jgi:hypothetical protein
LSSPRGRRKRWTIGIVAVAMSLVVAAGSAYALGLFEPATQATEPPSAAADAQAAAAESATLRAELTTEVRDAQTVLRSRDGKAAERTERRALGAAITDAQGLLTSLGSVTWSPSGTEEEATAVLELATTLHAEVPAVRSELHDATRAVVASGRQVRLERAVSELKAARTGLHEAATVGEQAYAETAETADTADRDGLRAALDRAAELSVRADELLETAARAPSAATVGGLLGQARKLAAAMAGVEARVEKATAVVLAEAADDVAAEADAAGTEPAAKPATTQDTGTDPATTPAGTCPEPDQVWSAENGHLSSSELAEIPFAPGHYVRSDVVGGLAELNAAYAAEFGVNLTINSSYRSYEQQEALYDPSSDTAAPPGCSNHGTGLAVDIGGGVEAFGSARYDWLKANAEPYGWVHPPFAEPTGRNPEPWHWQSVLAPNSY